MLVQSHFCFEAQRISRAQTAGHDGEFLAGCKDFVPDSLALNHAGRDIDFKAILAGVTGTRDQNVFQAANRAMGEPIIFHAVQIGVGQLFQDVHGARPLNRQLSVSVTQVLHLAIE